MKTKLKFVVGEWYKHTKYSGIVIHVLKRISTNTYQVKYYSTNNTIKPKYLGTFNVYFFSGDGEWELHENILQEV